jgi:hypothetical protein
VKSYNDLIIIFYILNNQCSTGPSAITGTENGIISGWTSGSADYIAIISLDSSTSVNLILFILSKHFLRCDYTACGLRV